MFIYICRAMPKSVQTPSLARTALFALTVFIVLLGVMLFLLLGRPLWLFHRQDFKTGNEIVARVESFRKSHAHLPETLKEVGMDEENLNVFFRKMNEDEYIVWFGLGLGQSETYNSLTKKWE
jgi:hypothetical protein